VYLRSDETDANVIDNPYGEHWNSKPFLSPFLCTVYPTPSPRSMSLRRGCPHTIIISCERRLTTAFTRYISSFTLAALGTSSKDRIACIYSCPGTMILDQASTYSQSYSTGKTEGQRYFFCMDLACPSFRCYRPKRIARCRS
jgi:hypothetical protein